MKAPHLIVVTILVALVLAPVIVLTAFFAVEVLAGLRSLGSSLPSSGRLPSAMIIVPAHDEEAVIGRTVAALRSAAPNSTKVLVVADNCTDRTAEEAAATGATVLIRNDHDNRGKGFALAAARNKLRDEPPDVVLVVDADCRLDEASLAALCNAAAGFGRPCQAVNLLAPQLDGPALVQISTFAFMIKNLIRQRGLQRLAGRAHLTGTGMALPWEIFAGVDLGGSNIVEDLALGLELASRAAPPVLIEGATVWSPPASSSGTLVQRRRWEGGYLATALKSAPSALARSILRADARALCAALDLCVPPLALLFVLNAIAFLVALVGALVGAPVWPLIVQAAVGFLAFVVLGVAWAREGRRFASGATLLRLPVYVLWKLPLYVGLARRGAPREWLRTGR